MSRLEEVEAEITAILRKTKRPQLAAAALARTLAAEVDARDEVITKLLEMLEPGPEPNCMDPQYNPSKRVSIYDVVRMWHEHRSSIHARAVAIAEGRDND